MRILKFAASLVLITVMQMTAAEEKSLTSEQWLEDLEFVVSKLKSSHPSLYYKTKQSTFDSIIAESRDEIMHSKSDLECYFAIRKIIAAIEDGHTQLLENGVFNLLDLRFPFRVDEFTDGVFVTLIRKDHQEFLGARLLSIDGMPIENVLETIKTVVNNDNRFGRKYWALNGIPFARILYGLKIIDDTDSIDLKLTDTRGRPRNVTLHSVPDDTDVEFGWSLPLDVAPTKGEYAGHLSLFGEKRSPYYKNRGSDMRYYWFEHLPKEKAVYFQFNQIANQAKGNETFARFSERMWDYIDRNSKNIDKLIIDLRQNNGGNGLMILPFLNQISKRDFINREGGIFAISSNRTYSAASIFLYELAVHTHAIFLGEPDGCGADLFSDNRPAGHLPNSRFPLWIASLQFTRRFPVNNSEYIMPHFPTPFSSRDYFSGNDPALDLIFNGDVRSVAEYAAEEGTGAAQNYYKQLKDKYKGIAWWTALDPEVLEGDINRKGYDLMQDGDLKDAARVFILNTVLFPGSANAWDSLGEFYFNMKNFGLSLQYYEKSIELDPNNESGKRMIERIKREQEKNESR